MYARSKRFIGLIALVLGLLSLALISSAWVGSAEAAGPGGNGARGQTTQGAYQQGMGTGAGMMAGRGGGAGQGSGAGVGMGAGRGGGAGVGMGAGRSGGYGLLTPTETGPLSAEAVKDLTTAINDEYHARALYQTVVDKFGSQVPFVNILRAENTHVAALTRLFTNHSLAVPADTYAGKLEAPATLQDAFKVAIQHETENAAMYDGFLKNVQEVDVVRVFTQLGTASKVMHLTALNYYSKL